jgi:sensor domain CHASE-containing protein
MKILRNEKGFALVFVLILAAIALVMTLGMLFMVSRGSYVSGQQKRYRTAVEAGRGGVESMLQLIASRGIAAGYMTVGNQANLNAKLDTPTTGWIGLDNAITIDPAAPLTYDMRVDLGAYRVYSKIVDTVQGNSSASDELLKTGVVNTSSGEVVVVSIPYLYTIEALSQSQTNTTERAKFSVLFQY